MNKTIFSDIDGTLLFHHEGLDAIKALPPQILPGVQEKLKEWRKAGHYIILVSARPDTVEWYNITIHHLKQFKIQYDRLILGVRNWPRVLINDTKPDMDETCFAHTVPRNKGLEDLNI